MYEAVHEAVEQHRGGLLRCADPSDEFHDVAAAIARRVDAIQVEGKGGDGAPDPSAPARSTCSVSVAAASPGACERARASA